MILGSFMEQLPSSLRTIHSISKSNCLNICCQHLYPIFPSFHANNRGFQLYLLMSWRISGDLVHAGFFMQQCRRLLSPPKRLKKWRPSQLEQPLSLNPKALHTGTLIMKCSEMETKYSFLEENYTLDSIIGRGGFSTVWRAMHKETGEVVAVKIIEKSQVKNKIQVDFDTERLMLRGLEHANICRLYHEVECKDILCIVQEYYGGGDLFKYVEQKSRLAEDDARGIFSQIVAAVEYLHSHQICHRDLKLENVLLDGRCHAKLIDFGLSATFDCDRKEKLNLFCGSVTYAAPELVTSQPYDGFKADIWSLGVCLYCCLNGFFPFYHTDYKEIKAQIQAGAYEEPDWLSEKSCRFLRWLLQKDPNSRPSAQSILSSSWCQSYANQKQTHKPDDDDAAYESQLLDKMSKFYGATVTDLKKEIEKNDFSSNVLCTYRLLVDRKRKYGYTIARQFNIRIPQTNMTEAFGVIYSPTASTHQRPGLLDFCNLLTLGLMRSLGRPMTSPYLKQINLKMTDPHVIAIALKAAFQIIHIEYQQASIEPVISGIDRASGVTFEVEVKISISKGQALLYWSQTSGPTGAFVTIANGISKCVEMLLVGEE